MQIDWTTKEIFALFKHSSVPPEGSLLVEPAQDDEEGKNGPEDTRKDEVVPHEILDILEVVTAEDEHANDDLDGLKAK